MAKVRSKKQYREKHDMKKNNIEKGKGRFFSISYLSYIILCAIFLFSFYIRGIVPKDAVLGNGVVGFAMDDAVFHMRLVENTIQFFPHRIFFDAFTLYPSGTSLHWGPLFDQAIAFLSLVAGLVLNGGMPSQITIDTIGVFFPAIIGALVVFPVFVIGKEIMNYKAGLLGAFLIAILPGQFLSRSVLGFTDHHIAEVFFTTLMMAFFIMAIKRAENITFDHWLNRDWGVLKLPIVYSILSGISFGAFLLSWTYGVFFAAVFGIFIVVQYIIDHFRNKSTEYLGIIGIISYTTAMIMVLPYIDIHRGFIAWGYSLLHLTVTGGGALIFLFLSVVSREMNKREYNVYHYLSFVIGTILIFLIVFKIFIPELYDATFGSWNSVFMPHTGGGLTIAEATPLSYQSGIANFGYNYFISYISIILLCYYAIKKSNAEYTLLVIWSVFVLEIMLAQNRFAYYYAVNAAILSGVIGSRLLDAADWKHFNSNDIIECMQKMRVQHILSLIIILAVVGFLPSDASPYKSSCGEWPWSCNSTRWGALGEGQSEWHAALTWMRNNTPQPDLPYYLMYEKPPNGQNYNYTKNDYGVMSWWDYGHIITYWGHRIPNANPFQAGIGGGANHAPGASTFLIAPTEDEANAILEKLGINGKSGARYVVSNAYMAYSIQPVFAEWDETDEGYYEQVQTSRGIQIWPSMKYFNTIESKLHIFDTTGLRHYRLVHESTPNPYVRGGNEEKLFKQVYNLLKRDNVLPVEESGYAKIFEYVKGARITGRAPPNTTVTLNTTIRTNIGRMVQYKQETSSNGTYVFTVPYSTQGPIPYETQFDTMPIGPYNLTVSGISKQLDVSEKHVLEGETITFDLVRE